MHWILLPINPEPWAVGPIMRTKGGARIGRNEQLYAYQQAVKEGVEEFLSARGLETTALVTDGLVKLEFYFWRRQDTYESKAGRKVTKHFVDTTNMQKATEDALHGLFFENDSQCFSVKSVTVEQGTEVEPMILIGVDQLVPVGAITPSNGGWKYLIPAEAHHLILEYEQSITPMITLSGQQVLDDYDENLF